MFLRRCLSYSSLNRCVCPVFSGTREQKATRSGRSLEKLRSQSEQLSPGRRRVAHISKRPRSARSARSDHYNSYRSITSVTTWKKTSIMMRIITIHSSLRASAPSAAQHMGLGMRWVERVRAADASPRRIAKAHRRRSLERDSERGAAAGTLLGRV